jgi:hypothetical protein
VATSLPYPGIDHPEIWRELLSRGAMLRATATHLGEIIDRGTHSMAVADVVTGFAAAAAYARVQQDDQSAVSAAAARWRNRLEEQISAPAAVARDRALFEAMVEDLAHVHSGDPFLEVFEAVADLAAMLYEENWPAQVPFAASYRSTYHRHGQDRYGVRASVGGTDLGMEVKLRLYPRDFGPEAYAALPCAFAHECICHVPAQQLGVVDNASLFAEGFMDWATTYWLRCWGAFLPVGFGSLVEKHEALYRAALVAEGTDESDAREGGRRAAGYLSRQLQRHHGYEAERACERVASFAARLNVHEAPLRDKEGFVDGIDIYSEAPLQEPLLGTLKGDRPAADVL